MRFWLIIFVFSGSILGTACANAEETSDIASDASSSSPFWDTKGDYHGPIQGAWGELPNDSPAELFESADSVVVARIDEVVSEDFQTIPPGIEGPGWEKYGKSITSYFAETPYRTTFKATPLQWIKGDVKSEFTITDHGGTDPRGVQVGIVDGDLMLESGRTYLLFLIQPDNWPGDYARTEVSRGTFDLTTGKILVMNHPFTRDLEKYEGLTLDDFLSQAVGLSSARSQ